MTACLMPLRGRAKSVRTCHDSLQVTQLMTHDSCMCQDTPLHYGIWCLSLDAERTASLDKYSADYSCEQRLATCLSRLFRGQ